MELDCISPSLLPATRLLSFFLLTLLLFLPTRSHLLSFSLLRVISVSVHLSKLPPLLHPMPVLVSRIQQSFSLDILILLLLVSELVLVSIMAPSSLIANKCWKTSAHCYIKQYPQPIYFKTIQFIQFTFIPIYMCICMWIMCTPDKPPTNVTANKNQPSSYRFTQAKKPLDNS